MSAGRCKQAYWTILCSRMKNVFGVRMPSQVPLTSDNLISEFKSTPWNNWEFTKQSKYYDPMHMLPTSYEISVLAEWSVAVSDSLNQILKLPHQPFYEDDIQRNEDMEAEVALRSPSVEPYILMSSTEDGWPVRWLKMMFSFIVMTVLTSWSLIVRGFFSVVLPYIHKNHPNFR